MRAAIQMIGNHSFTVANIYLSGRTHFKVERTLLEK
jgi:hypothetical protein